MEGKRLMSLARRCSASILSLALLSIPLQSLAATTTNVPSVYELTLPKGQTAIVRGNLVQVFSKTHHLVAEKLYPPGARYDGNGHPAVLPAPAEIANDVMAGPQRPFVAGRVIVVYRDGVSAPRDVASVDPATLRSLRKLVATRALSFPQVPAYTNNAALNRTFATLGVDRSERLFRAFNRSQLESLHASAVAAGGSALDFSNAYRLHISASSVQNAVKALSTLPQIAYVSPDWSVRTMRSASLPVQRNVLEAAKMRARAIASRPVDESNGVELPMASHLPTNYALTSSLQSSLNTPSLGVSAAYDEIESRFNQLPGEGERITNVSIGDLDSATTNINDPCYGYVSGDGPTTILQGGQRYLNLPSMPLIPTYTADDTGDLNGSGEVCGTDPSIGEIGLDFSVMAPLPHNLQRSGETGDGLTDLLGIAPGAQYRLVVPASSDPGTTDIDGAILAAALQTPRPDVITASLGFGFDEYGFPSRYLEEDPITESIVASIVNQYHIVVCIAANDGTRTYTNVAIGPSGGSAPTNTTPTGGTPSSINDDELSTAPAGVLDSGSIDVGGTTLDDIFANPPQYATGAAVAQHAYTETRWTGFRSFSSGYGSRVNVSAPSDNIVSFTHETPQFNCTFPPSGPPSCGFTGGQPDSVDVVLTGGTSASAPETAAAAAVLLQVARLTGHPFTTPQTLRKYLEQSGTPVPNVSQADSTLNVGNQVDLRSAVEGMLAKSTSASAKPHVVRVAVEQRRDYGGIDAEFMSDTNRNDIAIGTDPVTNLSDELSWITIAPDWEYVPATATYRLVVAGHPQSILATTPWARLLPATILKAAGESASASSGETVKLRYEARNGSRIIASTPLTLTFTGGTSTLVGALAPNVPSVVTGTTIPVKYDLTGVSGTSSPQLVVSEPGRVDPATGALFRAAYTAPITGTTGTIKVPVSALQGAGIYGIGIELQGSATGTLSDFAFTRVEVNSSTRATAPLLASNGSAEAHTLEIPYNSSFQVHYDVKNVPNATGAQLEISAAGPTAYGNENPFNNPNGSREDNNGTDTGSIYYVPLSGTSGTVTVNAKTAGLLPTLIHLVRVIPMRYGQAAGEASDASSVTMDGILPNDGGAINGGFAVNPGGTDGFLTSNQETAGGEILSSVETFDQISGQITGTTATSAGTTEYLLGSWGFFPNDTSMVDTEPEVGSASPQYNLLAPVSSNTLGATWSPPSGLFVYDTALNTVNETAASLAFNLSVPPSQAWHVFTSNIATNTVGQTFDLSPALTSMGSPEVGTIMQNPGGNIVAATALDVSKPGLTIIGNTTMVTLNLTTGALASFDDSLGHGTPEAAAIDPGTNLAAVLTTFDSGLSIYNLTSQAGAETNLGVGPDFAGVSVSNDPTHNWFVIAEPVGQDALTNNNAISNVVVYDESGNHVETLERFSWFDGTFILLPGGGISLNPSQRSGYVSGHNGTGIEPFSY
jgi:hypothetical protein